MTARLHARFALFGALLLGAFVLCPETHATPPRATVVWISVDGLRPDYIERARTPTFDRLAREGLSTRELAPTFPSLTFPVHVSQATGVPPSVHGIVSNTFYDRRRERVYRYPPWANMVEAEPIWNTATRQGLRAAVQDWPLAHAQQGPHAAAYFLQRFDFGLSDSERLDTLLDIWSNDEDRQPLRLLVTWIGDPDRAGHEHGPDSEKIVAVIEQTDALIGNFLERAVELWQRRKREADDALFLLISTDHGMSPVHTLVNAAHLTGLTEPTEDIVLLTSGNIGHLYLSSNRDAEWRDAIQARVFEAIAGTSFARAWRRETLPDNRHCAHPFRTGDIMLELDSGYSFSARPKDVTAPVEDFGGPLGMHGYAHEEDPNMLGIAMLWRWPEPLGGFDLGPVGALQWHPTVAALLGIDPAEGAQAPPIMIEKATAP